MGNADPSTDLEQDAAPVLTRMPGIEVTILEREWGIEDLPYRIWRSPVPAVATSSRHEFRDRDRSNRHQLEDVGFAGNWRADELKRSG